MRQTALLNWPSPCCPIARATKVSRTSRAYAPRMSDLPTIIVGMATITLSNGLAATVDESDYRGLAAHKWHAVRKRVAGVYAYRQHYGSGGGVRKIRTIYMHREVLGVTD